MPIISHNRRLNDAYGTKNLEREREREGILFYLLKM